MSATHTWSARELLGLKVPELNHLYRGLEPGPLPEGSYKGTLLIFPGTPVTRVLAAAARPIFQGKTFGLPGNTLINHFFGFRVITARYRYGTSRVDDGPAIEIDYRETSALFRATRDELRLASPGVYLALMYFRLKPDRFIWHFVLEKAQ